MISISNISSYFRKTNPFPPVALLSEDGVQIAFKEFADVGEILFGVIDRNIDRLKCLIHDRHNPLLFREWWNSNFHTFDEIDI